MDEREASTFEDEKKHNTAPANLHPSIDGASLPTECTCTAPGLQLAYRRDYGGHVFRVAGNTRTTVVTNRRILSASRGLPDRLLC